VKGGKEEGRNGKGSEERGGWERMGREMETEVKFPTSSVLL